MPNAASKLRRRCANALRFLAMDAVQQAMSAAQTPEERAALVEALEDGDHRAGGKAQVTALVGKGIATPTLVRVDLAQKLRRFHDRTETSCVTHPFSP